MNLQSRSLHTRRPGNPSDHDNSIICIFLPIKNLILLLSSSQIPSVLHLKEIELPIHSTPGRSDAVKE